MSEGVRFIRVNGRIVPIREKKGSGSKKPGMDDLKKEAKGISKGYVNRKGPLGGKGGIERMAVGAGFGLAIGAGLNTIATLGKRVRLAKQVGKVFQSGSYEKLGRLTKVGASLGKVNIKAGLLGAFAGAIANSTDIHRYPTFMRRKKKD